MEGGQITGIIFFLVTGSVLALFFFFRSKDRQLIIEKGLSPEVIQNMFKYKWNPYIWLKMGVVVSCGSLGILIGNYLMWAYPLHYVGHETGIIYTEENPAMMIFSIFFMIGIGFILAFYLSKKVEREEEARKENMK